jgi:MSHA biogenesis protein MshJ
VRAALNKLAARIDDASLRERLLVFLAAAGLLLAAAQFALFEPLDVASRDRRASIRSGEEELANLQRQLGQQLAGRGAGVDKAVRERVEKLRRELAAVNARIAEEERAFTPPERMRETLERMLEPHARLALGELKTLPAQPIAASDPNAQRPAAYRHGVQLVLRGTYPDLYEYLRSLESLPTRVYWGPVELQAHEYPVHTLRVTLYTISFDRAWLSV